MRVIAIDGGDEKRDLCKKLGAEAFIDFTTTKDIVAEVMKITTYGAHGVLVTAASKEGYATAPTLLRPGGTMVAVGLPKDPTVLAGAPPIMLCLKKLNIVGSVVGTLKDVEEALDFTARGLVHVRDIPVFLTREACLHICTANSHQGQAVRFGQILSIDD